MPLSPEETYTVSQSPLFRMLSGSAIGEITALSTKIEVAASTPLVVAGDHAEMLYVILDGIATVQLPTPWGPHPEPVSAPYVCGWTGLLHPYRYLATVRTATNCHLAAIPVPHLMTMIGRHDQTSALLLEQLGRVALRRIEDIHALIEGRVAFNVEAGA